MLQLCAIPSLTDDAMAALVAGARGLEVLGLQVRTGGEHREGGGGCERGVGVGRGGWGPFKGSVKSKGDGRRCSEARQEGLGAWEWRGCKCGWGKGK